MNLVQDLTADVGKGLIADVAGAIADALLAKGLITADQKADTIGSVNFLGDIALNAYLANKAK